MSGFSLLEVANKFNLYFGGDITETTDDAIEVECEHFTERMDHFICGDSDCECDEEEGWCDKWNDECEIPAHEEVQEFLKTQFDEKERENFVLDVHVGEKGTLYLTFKSKEREPEKKKAKK